MRISDWSSDVCSSDLKENPTTYRWAVMRRPRGSRLHVEAGPEICRESSALAVESLQHRADLDRDRDVLPIRDLGAIDHQCSGLILELEIGRASCRESVCQSV